MARGYADLPLHYGRVPRWLSERMKELGGAIVEAIACEFGRAEVLRRLSDPFWFQSFGCVLGMDWHSSGITTSVMGALKRAINPMAGDLGIYVCGGRGKQSRKTPEELLEVGSATGLNGDALVRASKLSAKIDNTAVQDGFQLYLHSFIVSVDGDWVVVQQGMNDGNRMARRYHWHSADLASFVEEPHSAVIGQNQGLILNLTDREAEVTRNGLTDIAQQHPDRMMAEIRKLVLPQHHEVIGSDVNLKRLASVLVLANDTGVQDFASMLLLKGLGPRTLQSLTLVSEVIYGTPSQFQDPARFAFAHGGKDGHPFPVPLKVYDQSIRLLKDAVGKAKIGRSDKLKAIQKLDQAVRRVENEQDPWVDMEAWIAKERREAPQHGGRTVFDPPKKQTKKKKKNDDKQPWLFDFMNEND